jgi:hypothetical protein
MRRVGVLSFRRQPGAQTMKHYYEVQAVQESAPFTLYAFAKGRRGTAEYSLSVITCSRASRSGRSRSATLCTASPHSSAHCLGAGGGVAIQGRARAVECPANVGNRAAIIGGAAPGELPRRIERLRPRPATVPPTRSRRCQHCLCAFADRIAFELGERAKDMKDQFPGASGGVDTLSETPEADAALVQRRNRFDEVLERAAEPI